MKQLIPSGRAGRFLARVRSAGPAEVTQGAYIAEAAFEYFITMTAAGPFLTLLLKQMNVSDALTGILSSLVTLACGTQAFAILFIRRRRSIRSAVLFMQTIQQLLYGGMFLIPFLSLPQAGKIALFTAVFLFASVLSNLIQSSKYNWMNSFVEPGSRGVFTARKEIVSLVTGLTYNFLMSRAVDRCNAAGRPGDALRLCAAAIFIITVFHILSLLAAHDAPGVLEDAKKTPSLRSAARSCFGNRSFVRLLVLAFLWNFAYYLSTPYYNVYLLQELGCSVTFIAAAGIVGSMIRMFVSMPVARYCDRRGFARGVEVGGAFAAISFLLLGFWIPANGRALYLLYQLPFAFAQAALSGGMYNIVFQYVPVKDRVSALGFHLAAAGLSGFLGSLAGGWLLNAVQAGGNRLFGVPLYGQQLLNFLAFLLCVGLCLYARLAVESMKRTE